MEVIEITREQRYKRKFKSFASRCEETPLRLSEKAVGHLLNDLCVTLGYCLPQYEQERIINNPPTNPRQFAEVVMEAEGVGTDASTMFDPVFDMVCKAFLQASENDA